MKNLRTLICLLAAFTALYGCSKTSTNTLIVGKWYESTARIDSVKNGQTTTISAGSSPDGSYLQLNANGTGTVYDPPYNGYADTTITITYTLSASTLTLNYPAYDVYGYSYQAHSVPWSIISVTSKELNLKYTRTGGNPNTAAGEFEEYISFTK